VADFIATCSVEGCEIPTQDYLCTGCMTELATMFRELASSTNDRGEQRPGLLADLDDTVFRLDNVRAPSTGPSGKGDEQPLLIREDASDLKHEVRNIISTWSRLFAETHSHLTPTYTTHEQAAEWMAEFPLLLAMHPAAGEMFGEIRDASRRIRRMIDQAPERVFLGTCGVVIEGEECKDGVYAIGNRSTGRCRTCGAEFSTDERREWMSTELEDQLAIPAQLTTLVSSVGAEIGSATIRQWVRRGKLRQALDEDGEPTVDDNGRAMYRLGDVLDIVQKRNQRDREDVAA
jgi:Lon protease-like protein